MMPRTEKTGAAFSAIFSARARMVIPIARGRMTSTTMVCAMRTAGTDAPVPVVPYSERRRGVQKSASTVETEVREIERARSPFAKWVSRFEVTPAGLAVARMSPRYMNGKAW